MNCFAPSGNKVSVAAKNQNYKKIRKTMIKKIESEKRGKTDIGWLKSRHSFSFSDFYDETMIHFGPLRVLNDDYVAPGGGFPTHPHKDMEIITYVVNGSVRHQDSMGSSEIIGVNQIQKMSAGKGVYHSEFNASREKELHLYQTWIIPSKRGLAPSYETKTFKPEDKLNKLLKIASPDGSDDSIVIVQDASMYISRISTGTSLSCSVRAGNGIYIHVVEGSVQVNGEKAAAGDAVTLENENSLIITAEQDAEIILFDVAMNFAH